MLNDKKQDKILSPEDQKDMKGLAGALKSYEEEQRELFFELLDEINDPAR